MNWLVRNVLILCSGIALTMVTISCIQFVSSKFFFTVLENIDFANKDDLARLVDVVPFGALLMVELSYIVGSFAGGFLIGWLAENMI